MWRMARINGRRKGFTLVELMVVVAVIAVVAALALPGITQAKKRANETSALSALRTLSTAQHQYRLRFSSYGGVADLRAAGLIDQNFADAEKAGYRFSDAVPPPSTATWSITAEPLNPGISGDRYFYVDLSGVIRFRDGAVAGAGDAPID